MLAVARFGGQVHLKKGAKGELNSCKEVLRLGFYFWLRTSKHEGTFIDILGNYEGYILGFILVYNLKRRHEFFLKKQRAGIL